MSSIFHYVSKQIYDFKRFRNRNIETLEDLTYDAAAGLVKEGARYAQKAYAGEASKKDLVPRPPLERGAKSI